MNPLNRIFQPSPPKQSSFPCSHKKLILLPERKYRLRCGRCRRIFKDEAPHIRYCPGCYEVDSVKRDVFRKTNIIDVSFALYRCEDCGVMIHAG